GGQVFGVTWPPRTRADQVLLHAPMTVEYELPAGASRVAATVELALDDVPVHARSWADCDVTVTAQGSAPQQIHLTAAQPKATINLPIDGAGLIIQLDAGAHGPMLDRVRLVDAMVLVRVAGP